MENDEKKVEKHFIIRTFELLGIKLIFIIIFLVAISILAIYYSYNSDSDFKLHLIHEVSKGLLITALLAGVIKWFINRQFTKDLKSVDDIKETIYKGEMENLKNEIKSQTDKMTEYSLSLGAMEKTGTTRFYQNRNEASKDINEAIKNSFQIKNSEIFIIGISLNDFTRDEHHELHEAWNLIKTKIKESNNNNEIKIKALILDPKSNGGHLRAQAESFHDTATRLDLDIKKAISDFTTLEIQSKDKRITFESKLYRICPILYMIWTPNVAFIQPYYFRDKHVKTNVNIPVLKIIPQLGIEEFKLHNELKFHFEWIWKSASISIDEYDNKFSYGTFEGINKSLITNIYYDYGYSKNRIISLIKDTSQTLLIKGISLHSYFNYDELTDALFNACKRNVDVKILLIDYDSPEAIKRSFREYSIFNKDLKFNEYEKNKDLIKESRLVKDTKSSIDTIKSLNKELRKIGSNVFKVKKYESAPDAFILITDNNVLVEQYHYGKIGKNAQRTILGGDVPLVEYLKPRENIIGINPYDIFKDNFDFIYEHFSKEI